MSASFPLPSKIVDPILSQKIPDFDQTSIGQMVEVVSELQKLCGVSFLRMEFGSPGLEPDDEVVRGEVSFTEDRKLIQNYPPLTGLPRLKEAASQFLKAFLDLDIQAQTILPTVGSMQAGLLAQGIAAYIRPNGMKILYVDPCFSVHRAQAKYLGIQEASVDLYDRKKWLDTVEKLVKEGEIGGILYSSPNNPTWVTLTEGELERLGSICDQYNVIAIEDAAYLGMDFRRDYSKPFQKPFVPTILKYTDNAILLLSASKLFSMAGHRVGLAAVSSELAGKKFSQLKARFGYEKLWDALVHSGMYATTSGVSTSAQSVFAGMLEASCEGRVNYLERTREYARRAAAMKKILLKNRFELVYKDDLGEPISDGFMFTFSYPGMKGADLARALIYFGISSTTLSIAKSVRIEAVRACVSQISSNDISEFERRIQAFREHYPQK